MIFAEAYHVCTYTHACMHCRCVCIEFLGLPDMNDRLYALMHVWTLLLALFLFSEMCVYDLYVRKLVCTLVFICRLPCTLTRDMLVLMSLASWVRMMWTNAQTSALVFVCRCMVLAMFWSYIGDSEFVNCSIYTVFVCVHACMFVCMCVCRCLITDMGTSICRLHKDTHFQMCHKHTCASVCFECMYLLAYVCLLGHRCACMGMHPGEHMLM
jgi:hypothetical protein